MTYTPTPSAPREQRIEAAEKALRAAPSTYTEEQIQSFARGIVHLEDLAVSDPEKFDHYMSQLIEPEADQ